MRTIVVNDIFDVICDLKLTILALDGVFDTGFSAVLDAFTTANDLAAIQQPGVGPHFEIDVIGMRRDVRTALGVRVPVKPVSAMDRPDWLVVPALATKMPEQRVPALQRRNERFDWPRAERRGTLHVAEPGRAVQVGSVRLVRARPDARTPPKP
ncbi:hypothetical protein [Trinickia mobilis]|uniref:hypothetical protein n=1 Tax=Trinickia mobilis TaxID=2816356 RepID=UPI001A8F4F07|nr:hypothetical protein [Trinickia mobilis]